MNKYFAISSDQKWKMYEALVGMGYEDIEYREMLYSVIYNNILSEEDYVVIKLRFNIIEPSKDQLTAAKVIYDLDWIQVD